MLALVDISGRISGRICTHITLHTKTTTSPELALPKDRSKDTVGI
jgi:hypothetical protein